MKNRKSIARYHNALLITSCGRREWKNSIGRKTGSVTGYDEAIRCTGGRRLRGLLKRFRDINRLCFKIVARDDDVRTHCRYTAIADRFPWTIIWFTKETRNRGYPRRRKAYLRSAESRFKRKHVIVPTFAIFKSWTTKSKKIPTRFSSSINFEWILIAIHPLIRQCV